MTIKSLSKVKYYLTEAVRNLQMLLSVINKDMEDFLVLESEIKYWIDALLVIRDLLYNAENSFDSTSNMKVIDSIKEVQSDIHTGYMMNQHFTVKELSYISKAWTNCKKAVELLK